MAWGIAESDRKTESIKRFPYSFDLDLRFFNGKLENNFFNAYMCTLFNYSPSITFAAN